MDHRREFLASITLCVLVLALTAGSAQAMDVYWVELGAATLTVDADSGLYFTVAGAAAANPFIAGYNQLATAEIDVSDMNIAIGEWHTIIDVINGEMGGADMLDFVDGTDPNWLIQIADGNKVQIMLEGDDGNDGRSIADLNGDGCVDGGDLGMILARWKDTDPLIADIAPVATGGDGIVDGADLGAILARWGDGCDDDNPSIVIPWPPFDPGPFPAPTIPEPASAMLLLVGFAGIFTRCRRTG